MKTAILIALNEVDPAYYGGWDGRLAWPTQDSHKIAQRLIADGYSVITLHNATATRGMVESTVLAQLRKHTDANDTVAIHVSSHGGQVADTSGDEIDGKDETWCLYNGNLSDDVVATWAAHVRCRVLIVSDKCHAADSLRSGPVVIRRKVQTVTLHPQARIVHLAGCSEGGTSMESSPHGGHWTHAVCAAWDALFSPIVLRRSIWQWLRGVPPRKVPRARPTAFGLADEASDRLARQFGGWQEPVIEAFGGDFTL